MERRSIVHPQFEVALAALAALPGDVIPLPGPTRVETARSAARAPRLELTDAERERLAECFPVFRARWLPRAPAAVPTVDADRDIVIIMGLPGAGKSTMAGRLVAEGYTRAQSRRALDPARCLYVGASGQDRLFAQRLGFEYRAADEFFGVIPM